MMLDVVITSEWFGGFLTGALFVSIFVLIMIWLNKKS